MGFIRSEEGGSPEEKKKMVATQGKSNEAEIESLRDQRVSALESKGKSNEAEIESLRDQRVSALESKVDDLTKEMDTLHTEQKKSDAAALPKEENDIINQVMAKVEELSKKQAAQESQISKLMAQIREFEEEKKGLNTKLQVEENKVESIRTDKAATEKLLKETIEKHQVELATQKEYYTNVLNAAKEAEARANNEARTAIESQLREAEERETVLVQELEGLRQTLSGKEQQAFSTEDKLRREIRDLQNMREAFENGFCWLIMQAYESIRPLSREYFRQIQDMQEMTARRAEEWAAVERSLNSRLQEAEGTAAAAEERERSVNERLSQTLSRINVLEAQISYLRTEQTQLTSSGPLSTAAAATAEEEEREGSVNERLSQSPSRINVLEAQASMESTRDSLRSWLN